MQTTEECVKLLFSFFAMKKVFAGEQGPIWVYFHFSESRGTGPVTEREVVKKLELSIFNMKQANACDWSLL